MPMQPKLTITNTAMKALPATIAGEEALNFLRAIPGDRQIAVGLSGGVDSSLAAALLLEAGWDVEGITLWLMSGKGSCCSEGLVDASGICKQLGIPHHVLDTRESFQKEIIQEVVKGYQSGVTPLPCSRCNRFVKFSPMLQWAKENRQINRIATGHYARTRLEQYSSGSTFNQTNAKKRIQLLRGMDSNKDQSYFLYDLSQEVLNKVIFPLGELSKADTRKEANKLDLRTAEKPESQDLCLAEHHGSMRAFLDNFLPSNNGEITLKDGTVLGTHDGIEHFTIGQRKGLGVSWKEPLHVIKLDSKSNTVVVAPRDEAGTSNCTVGEINWVSIDPPKGTIQAEVQVRYRSQPVLAQLSPIQATNSDIERDRPHRCQVCFQEKQFSIAPGQAAVFYCGEVLLGGGIIQP